MELEAAHAQGDEAARFGDGFGPACGIDAGESHHDVGVFGGQRGHRVVGDLRASGEALVYRKNSAANSPGAKILRQLWRARPGSSLAEILARRFVGGVAGVGFDVNVGIDGNQILMIHGKHYYKKNDAMTMRKICILHPGHMGVAVAATARNGGNEVYWASAGRSADTCRRAAEAALLDAGTVAGMCAVCPMIVSVCPPEFAEGMAHEIVDHGFRGLYIDANAISPERARRVGQLLESNGVAFVDGCIIGQPPAAPGETWICFSGPKAADAAALFPAGPLEAEVLEGDIGKASALKMCFSAHAKGMAALRAAVVGAADQLDVLGDLERQWARS